MTSVDSEGLICTNIALFCFCAYQYVAARVRQGTMVTGRCSGAAYPPIPHTPSLCGIAGTARSVGLPSPPTSPRVNRACVASDYKCRSAPNEHGYDVEDAKRRVWGGAELKELGKDVRNGPKRMSKLPCMYIDDTVNPSAADCSVGRPKRTRKWEPREGGRMAGNKAMAVR